MQVFQVEMQTPSSKMRENPPRVPFAHVLSGETRRKEGLGKAVLSPLFSLLRLLFSAAGQSCGPELCCWWCWLFYPTFSASRRCSVGKNNRLLFQRWHSTLSCFSTKTQQAARSVIVFFTTGLSAEQHQTPSEKLH